MASTCSSTPTPSPAKLMTLPQIPTSTSRFLLPLVNGPLLVTSVGRNRPWYCEKVLFAGLKSLKIGDLGDGKHDGGPDDPRICVIRVKAITAQHAISKRSVVGAFVELAKGVSTRDAPNIDRLR
jgi:hypothetical protein